MKIECCIPVPTGAYIDHRRALSNTRGKGRGRHAIVKDFPFSRVKVGQSFSVPLTKSSWEIRTSIANNLRSQILWRLLPATYAIKTRTLRIRGKLRYFCWRIA